MWFRKLCAKFDRSALSSSTWKRLRVEKLFCMAKSDEEEDEEEI